MDYQTFANRKSAADAAAAMLGWERPRPVLFYLPGDPRMLADIAERLVVGPVTVTVEAWQIVAGGQATA